MSLMSKVITGVRDSPPRVFLLGQSKMGKSTFAASAPSAVIIQARGETGVDGLDVARLPVVNSLTDLFSTLNELLVEDHPFKTVVLDSISALEPLVHEHVCAQAKVDSIEKVGGGFGKGYVEACNHFQLMTQYFDALREQRGIGVIVIGHLVIRRFDDPSGDSYDRWEPACNAKAANVISRWADCLWVISTKTVVRKEDLGNKQTHTRGIDPNAGARFLLTQPRPSHPGGGRGILGTLPYEVQLPPTNAWSHVMAQVSPTNAQ